MDGVSSRSGVSMQGGYMRRRGAGCRLRVLAPVRAGGPFGLGFFSLGASTDAPRRAHGKQRGRRRSLPPPLPVPPRLDRTPNAPAPLPLMAPPPLPAPPAPRARHSGRSSGRGRRAWRGRLGGVRGGGGGGRQGGRVPDASTVAAPVCLRLLRLVGEEGFPRRCFAFPSFAFPSSRRGGSSKRRGVGAVLRCHLPQGHVRRARLRVRVRVRVLVCMRVAERALDGLGRDGRARGLAGHPGIGGVGAV
ncbi:hypothetical protein CALCODRAFT_198939 [Calocera cornea HHB12733]|uniref:Uncharacterized protein n=1 Tax=Calocera cornea HHB12733 TaxID=1353952 RepID=A0A165HG36_9BASI|nr:hypothetical protein CALCODRAFT_198939 [Calocera cornea HHB12733]